MKIGIDASRLTEHKRTGTGNYLYQVIKSLSLIDKSNTYIVYFSENPSPEFIGDLFNQNPNFTHKTVKKVISWTQLSLAYNAMTDAVDVLFCSWHTIPILLAPKVKFVSVIHDMQLKTASPIFTLLTIVLSSSVIAVSNSTRADILKYIPFAKHKIRVIYEGVDTTLFTKAPPQEIARVAEKYMLGPNYLIYVGTIGHRKNIPALIEAFAKYTKLPDSLKNIQLLLAGTVIDEYTAIYALPKKFNVEPFVKFLGYVPAADLSALISGSLGLVYVSKAEGFGLPILEGMACGVPVLTSNISSMAEVAGDAAVLVSPDSVDAIKDGIKAMLSNSKALVAKGYDNSRKYTWIACSQKLLAELEKYAN